MIKQYSILFLSLLLFSSCIDNNPNLNAEGQDVFQANAVYVEKDSLAYMDTVYVPIYSEIYNESKDVIFHLTATLSIRNTSMQDSFYVKGVDYYDTNGDLVRKYLEKTILLKPLQTIEYVIEEKDDAGGTGANFIIIWGADQSDLKPMFQGVMISTHGQQGLSFTTEGRSISRRHLQSYPTSDSSSH
jgi:hypothetical protein